MAEEMPAGRPYRSPLRERQAAQTRELILRALADKIVDGGLHDLTIAAVALRAGVAERTAYRHFANVDAMLAGLRAMVGEQLGAHVADHPRLGVTEAASADEFIDTLPTIYAAFDAIGTPARAMAIIVLAQGDDPGRVGRRQALGDALADDLTHLDPASAHAVVETLHLLAGSLSWFLLTRDGTLTGDQAGEAAARVLRATLAGLRAERDATAPADAAADSRPH